MYRHKLIKEKIDSNELSISFLCQFQITKLQDMTPKLQLNKNSVLEFVMINIFFKLRPNIEL